MQSDPRRDMRGILRDDLGACDDREMILQLPSLQGGWDGHATFDECRWFSRTFIDNPAEESRLWRAVDAVPRFFNDLGALHYHVTGEPARLDHELISVLKRRVMQAIYPSMYEMVMGAKKHPATVAAKNLRQRIPRELWAKRLSS